MLDTACANAMNMKRVRNKERKRRCAEHLNLAETRSRAGAVEGRQK